MAVNAAKFRDNGQCGYVLKPAYLRNVAGGDYNPRTNEPSVLYQLEIHIISAHHLICHGRTHIAPSVTVNMTLSLIGSPSGK